MFLSHFQSIENKSKWKKSAFTCLYANLSRNATRKMGHEERYNAYKKTHPVQTELGEG